MPPRTRNAYIQAHSCLPAPLILLLPPIPPNYSNTRLRYLPTTPTPASDTSQLLQHPPPIPPNYSNTRLRYLPTTPTPASVALGLHIYPRSDHPVPAISTDPTSPSKFKCYRYRPKCQSPPPSEARSPPSPRRTTVTKCIYTRCLAVKCCILQL
jgi:hypothetical protein